MESNKRAIIILFTLVATSLILFLTEKKFLISLPRGTSLSNYEHIKWINNIHLLVDDFEGIGSASDALEKNKFFFFGSVGAEVDTTKTDKAPIASKTALKTTWKGTEGYGGWGKGIGSNIELNTTTDYVNFRFYCPKSNGDTEKLKVIIEEDDNENGILENDKDDKWAHVVNISSKDEWQFISIPLKSFIDENDGGDNIFNVTKKGGLHTIIFSFEQAASYTNQHTWYFDFICFSNKKIDNNDLIASQ
ncbi:MAG: hypothetical protein WAQ28_01730 [Bacteroidia bacterium]